MLSMVNRSFTILLVMRGWNGRKVMKPAMATEYIPSPKKNKQKSSPRKRHNKKTGRERDLYRKNYFHACESLLTLILEKRQGKTAILSLKKSGPELPELLNQFSAGIAGTGLAVIFSVVCKVVGGRTPFCASKLLNTGFGFGLVWLSWYENDRERLSQTAHIVWKLEMGLADKLNVGAVMLQKAFGLVDLMLWQLTWLITSGRKGLKEAQQQGFSAVVELKDIAIRKGLKEAQQQGFSAVQPRSDAQTVVESNIIKGNMDHPSPQSIEGGGGIRLPIDNKLSDNWGSGGTDTIFEPQRDSSSAEPGSSRTTVNAPEKKLTLFALQVAVLEKMATGLGTMGFIWATVVLLGGYAIKLSKIDFWIITIILLIEGARIFSRSHELEWQHQSTWTIADASIHSFRALKSSSHLIVRAMKGIRGSISKHQSRELKEKTNDERPSNRSTRTWISSEVPLLPYASRFFLSRNISKLFYWLQLLSALACITLSVVRLLQLSHGNAIEPSPENRNHKSALIVFYGLALAESFLSLLEKAYWEWTITYRKLLEEVNNECDLRSSGMISIQRFFYDAYSECINGSIFDGLKLDLVSFATELLASDSSDEQLIGARILQKFSTNRQFSDDTLQKIGTSTLVIERLVEMLYWKNPQEAEIRQAAANIVSKLAGKKQNSLRVAGIPGAMESIASLLYTQRSSEGASDEILEKKIVYDRENYEFSVFNQLGLTILKKLARDNDNCEKIGNTRGLLPKIIDFTHTGERLLKNSHDRDNRILAVKRSLQALKLLARTSGTVGKQLRQEIMEIVFTVSNIREILKHGEAYPMLQNLGIEILTSLAFEEEAREKIGSTGGIIKELLRIFFLERNPEDQYHVRVAAGEAITMLAMENDRNCSRILNQEVLTKLMGALKDSALRINSARILRNLLTYAGQDCFVQLKEVSAAAPTVLKAIMSEENKLQEVMLGLAIQVFRFMTPQEASIALNQNGIDEGKLAMKLLKILKLYQYPLAKVPRIRRFAIELAIWMMTNNKATVRTFKVLGMEEELEILRETTSEIESFNIFSGTVGLCRHDIAIHSLVDNALELLADG
ncbi:uncharacterized protein LOC122668454 [Telopea speciosissima]|uniref:uncharacterized protein LOC122668454 n=1 Tax=Telopea speciosissima TaxID=54955 RepID=UPI001CC3ABB6|nr:uncharacterized protein LOC122668454 [Telopea speciosissima]